MSTETPERPSPRPPAALRAAVAEEVRALLARRRMSAIELARRIGKSHTYVGRRLNGETAFDVDDLEQIAYVLKVSVTDLLGQRGPRMAGDGGVIDPIAYREDEIRGRMPIVPASLPDRPSGRHDAARPASQRGPSGPGRASRVHRPMPA